MALLTVPWRQTVDINIAYDVFLTGYVVSESYLSNACYALALQYFHTHKKKQNKTKQKNNNKKKKKTKKKKKKKKEGNSTFGSSSPGLRQLDICIICTIVILGKHVYDPW